MPAGLHATLESLAHAFALRLIHHLVTHDDTRAVADFVVSHVPPRTTARSSRAKPRRRLRNKIHMGPHAVGYPARGGNRGYAAIQADVERIVAFLVEARRPMMSLQIRTALGLTKDRFLRTAHRALQAGRIVAVGRMAAEGYVPSRAELSGRRQRLEP